MCDPRQAKNNADVSQAATVIEQNALRNVMDLDRKTKKKDKEKSSLNHFNCFLANFRKEAADDAEKKDFKYFKSYKEIVFEDLEKQEIFGNLCTYFSTHARKNCNPKAALLKYNSCLNYFSGIKNYYLDTFKGKADTLPCFSPRLWTKYYKELHGIKAQAARELGEALVEEKELATSEEVRALGALCFWEGTKEGIDFFSLNKCLYHLSARCCEAAGQLKKNLTYKELQESTHKFAVLQFLLDRHKTDVKQRPVVFIHRGGVLEDFYFGLAAQLLLDENTSPYLFPEFYKTVETKRAGDSIDSKSSSLWSQLYGKLMDLARSIPGK